VLAEGSRTRLKELTNGAARRRGGRPVGGDRFTDSLRRFYRGRLMVIGFTGGESLRQGKTGCIL